MKYSFHNALFSLMILPVVTAVFFLSHAHGGIYTSTKHGTSADRSVVTPGYVYTTLGHCGQCHEQHSVRSGFGTEITPPPAEGPSLYALFQDNFGTSSNELCYSCHQLFTISGMTLSYGAYGIYQGKVRYDLSVHNTSVNMVWAPDSTPPGPPFDDAGNCHNCHNPHGYDDGSGTTPIPYMLFAKDSIPADSPAYEMGCEACHDGTQAGVAKDVQAQLNKTYAHPTHTYNNRHTLPENGTSFETRHAECVDCHNPHTPGSTIHSAPGNSIASTSPLYGTWGVEPTWPSIWTEPVIFTVKKPPTASPNDMAQYEYQICFKCHSGYGLGTITAGVTAITGPSGTSITDQAWEFNPNNKSAHPVAVTLNNQTGSYAPKALESSQLKAPWNASPGDNTMYCSDCHGADDEATSAKGPHGSSRLYMLKGTGQYWPADASSTLWQWDTITNDLFCVNCHPLTGSNDTFGEHGRGQHEKPCVWCHIAVPHGSQRSRLIGYVSDPAPYDYSNNTLIFVGFKKAADKDSYGDLDCYTNHADCTRHNTNDGGYD